MPRWQIKGTGPWGLDMILDDVPRNQPLRALLTPSDVIAITIHREMGDFRYEREQETTT